jgi:hypothetical protein
MVYYSLTLIEFHPLCFSRSRSTEKPKKEKLDEKADVAGFKPPVVAKSPPKSSTPPTLSTLPPEAAMKDVPDMSKPHTSPDPEVKTDLLPIEASTISAHEPSPVVTAAAEPAAKAAVQPAAALTEAAQPAAAQPAASKPKLPKGRGVVSAPEPRIGPRLGKIPNWEGPATLAPAPGEKPAEKSSQPQVKKSEK